MKHLILSVFIFAIAVSTSFAQDKELSIEAKQALVSLPELKMPESYKNKSIPYIKNNADEIFFRDMFEQAGMSCGQASSVGLGFTYEMNCARNLAGNTDTTKYPTHFVYNWESNAYYGVSYYHTFDVLRLVGTPNLAEYGGTIDYGGATRWMTGYDLYYAAMKNRLRQAFKIDVRTEEGLLTLKHWMNDHLNGSPHGGVANFYDGVPSASYTLPSGTPEAGMYVVPSLSGGTSHAMTVVGYHDSIRYDYNNDGQYTNNIDLNGDGVIDMKDWEIGGVKIANTYSGGPDYANGGFIYVMYKTLAEGGFWSGLVYVQEVIPDYEPQLTAKVQLTYNKRKRLKVTAGISSDLSAAYPQHSMEFPIFDYQCGDQYMTGGSSESDKTIEFGLDLTPLLNHINPGQDAKFFLMVTEKDADAAGEGTIDSFSLMDYTGITPQEIECTQSNVSIAENSKTILSIGHDCNFEPPEITNTALPPAPVLAPFSADMSANGGTEPYLWEWDTDFDIEEQSGFLPSSGSSLGSGYIPVDLGFDFPFYDSVYSTVYVGSTGLIAFESGFDDYLPYNDDDHVVFSHTRCIAPFFISSTGWTVSSQNGTGYKSFLFENSTIDFAVRLYNTGEITLIYGNDNLSEQQTYVCGVSKGDERTSQKLFFDDLENIADGFSYHLTPHNYPDEFEISRDGEITGTPEEIYTGELLHVKVTDNNGLVDKVSLPIISSGLIFQTTVNTSDADDVVEYAETVNIDITATNLMSSSYTGISVELQTSDPYVTITDNTANLPDVSAGSSESLNNAFEFIVSGEIPDQHVINFNYYTTSNEGNFNYPLNLTAFAPQLFISGITISDANDNLFAAAETGIISLNILNTGGADANNISFSLTNDDNSLILDDTGTSLTGLEPEIDSNIVFNVHTISELLETETNHLHLSVAADNGFAQNLEFEIPVYTPDITLDYTQVIDGANGCLDENETADVVFHLYNEMEIAAGNLDISVTSTDPYITLNTNSANISNIGGLSLGQFTINVSIGNNVPDGHIIPVTLSVSGEHGYQTEINTVLPVGLIFEDWESGDMSQYNWETEAEHPWLPTDQEAFEGDYSLKSGEIPNNTESILTISFDVTADGDISFARKISSQHYYDFLDFMIDGVVQQSWSGELEWEIVSFPVAVGFHEFTWRYRKDIGGSSGEDAAWIDTIVFPPVIAIPPQFSVDVSSINKVMYPDSQDTDTITISNLGGGLLDFTLWLELDTGTKSVKNISGSEIVCNTDTYNSGDNIWNLMVNNAATDSEWIKTIMMNFPGGIDVQNSTNFSGGSGGDLIYNNVTGEGAEVIWTCDGYGNIHGGETASATMHVVVSDGIVGELAIPYEIQGDVYGSEPHTVTGELIFTFDGNSWLTFDPFSGQIGYDSDTTIMVYFNTEGMVPGFYYGGLTISHNNGSVDIPVQLQVLNPVGKLTGESDNSFRLYPNPAENTFFIETGSTKSSEISILTTSGKVLMKKEINGTEYIHIPSEWSNGIYFIELKNDLNTKKQKLIIMR